MGLPDTRYLVSLPERSLRSLSALCGGVLREIGEVALPGKIREAALYRATAGIGLRFLIEQAGDVRGIYPPEDPTSRKFVLRYAAGSSVELLSISAFFVSPVWVLAALGDVTRVGRSLIAEIGEALKDEGLLEPGTRFETMDQLLDGLERTSTHLALTVNMPPLDVAGLRQEWEQLRTNLARLPAAQLPAAAEVERAWRDLQRSARGMGLPVFSVSAAMGATALRAIPSQLLWLSRSAAVAAQTAGLVVGRVFLDHYAAALREMSKGGFGAYWRQALRPYMVGAIRQFLPGYTTWTERLLGKLG